MLKSVSLADWKVYLRWHMFDSYSGTLGEMFVSERFKYSGKDLVGVKKMPEMWKRGLGVVDGVMGDTLGQAYVAKHFPPKAKKRVNELVKNVTKAYERRIQALDWMSPKTKKRAIEKLHAIQPLLGYPSKWESYRGLPVSSESHTQNILKASLFDHKREMKKLGKPTDRKEWYMNAQTVNAYYSPNLNQIVFPAGILQPPFFYPDADDAVNYGAIGAVIGHELTHGFDDQGALFDGVGNMKEWWSAVDKTKFTGRTKKLVDQFNLYEVEDGVRVNGKLTLGENIADLGGVVISYDAFKLAQKKKKQGKIDGLTAEERFFIGFAISERVARRPELQKLIALNDVFCSISRNFEAGKSMSELRTTSMTAEGSSERNPMRAL